MDLLDGWDVHLVGAIGNDARNASLWKPALEGRWQQEQLIGAMRSVRRAPTVPIGPLAAFSCTLVKIPVAQASRNLTSMVHRQRLACDEP